ncbi:MAG: undecaprenyl/decaprenyl-phosphate alpha-N-acetylglucosaminyl 1-phosphate transferase [Elusimicrobia bacterium]|nr:undecaprenyl/decaprenyl-phosphate alpha-N-acetylglucosaminyl 1-phosphate transferase [Elusimicrobiota bacterium]
MDAITENLRLYLIAFLIPLLVSLIVTPLIRKWSVKLGFLDTPSLIKTHKSPTPAFGGISIAFSFALALIIMRFCTSFPTGTLRDLRIILAGGGIIFLLGLFDDLKKPGGLGFKIKFIVQFLVAFFVAVSGIRINFIEPQYLSFILSVFWIVGISNALNIIDIMDGLCASQVIIACMGFLFISLPSESIYVNFASCALAGAALGFIPCNFSKRHKIFLGDSGSLFCGFILALIAMGAKYSKVNPLGVYAPLFILAIPLYDTIFVSIMRLKRGESPFVGSRDHFALRFEKLGFSRHRIVILTLIAAAVLTAVAFLVTKVPLVWGILIYFIVGGEFIILSVIISKIRMHDRTAVTSKQP